MAPLCSKLDSHCSEALDGSSSEQQEHGQVPCADGRGFGDLAENDGEWELTAKDAKSAEMGKGKPYRG